MLLLLSIALCGIAVYMSRSTTLLSIFVASISVLFIFIAPQYSTTIKDSIAHLLQQDDSSTVILTGTTASTTVTDTTEKTQQMSTGNAIKNTMSKVLQHAKITPHRSGTRGHSDHGWLNTYHTFSFADWYNPNFTNFGSLRVLNEDRVKANSGFPTHPHRDFEIFSYILSGELTHRDSMLAKGKEGGQSDKFYRMKRGDVQFTTGGTGIAHSEFNEHQKDTVHFLQIWAIPWKRGLTPRYHTRTFTEEEKRKDFVKILSPLKAGEDASAQEEKDAVPAIEGTIPIHADFVMGAGIIAPESKFEWVVGAKATKENKRKVYVHVPMTKKGKAKIRVDGREDAELGEGDGAFIDNVRAGDKLSVESIGEVEAEVIVLDTA